MAAATAGGRPNILVTGTPGVGKTSFASELAARLGMTHINVGDFAAQHECFDGYDDERDCHILDEERVLDMMEDSTAGINIMDGGFVVDYHGCDFFPERFFQLVVVLRADNSILWERLEGRGYAQPKIQENVQAEIMQVILEEARESYNPDIVLVSAPLSPKLA